jgi:hypothetical protein
VPGTRTPADDPPGTVVGDTSVIRTPHSLITVSWHGSRG